MPPWDGDSILKGDRTNARDAVLRDGSLHLPAMMREQPGSAESRGLPPIGYVLVVAGSAAHLSQWAATEFDRAQGGLGPAHVAERWWQTDRSSK